MKQDEVYCMDARQAVLIPEMTHTLQAKNEGGWSVNFTPNVVYAIDQQGGKGGANWFKNTMPSLLSDSHGTPHGVAYSVSMDGKSKPDAAEDITPTMIVPDKQSKTTAVCYRKSTKAAKDMGDVWMESEVTNTLNGFEFHSQVRTPEVVIEREGGAAEMFENHSQDSRYTGPLKVAKTVNQQYPQRREAVL